MEKESSTIISSTKLAPKYVIVEKKGLNTYSLMDQEGGRGEERVEYLLVDGPRGRSWRRRG